MKKLIMAVIVAALSISGIAQAVPSNSVGAKVGGRVWYFDPSTFSSPFWSQALVAAIDSGSNYPIDLFVSVGGTVTLEQNITFLSLGRGSSTLFDLDSTPAFVQIGSQISVIDPTNLPNGQPFPILVTSTNIDGTINGVVLNSSVLDSNGDATYWTYTSVPEATGLTALFSTPCYLPMTD